VEEIMNRLSVVAFVLLGFIPNIASAVDIKNIRPCYGLFGPTRYKAECLPGDVLFFTFDIDGLAVDPKTKKVSYETTLQLLDAKDKVLDTIPTPANPVVPILGGNSMPGDLYVKIGDNQPPGKYTIQMTIEDKIGKSAKAFKYPFTVLKQGFGIIRAAAPAVGFHGQHHVLQFQLVNLTLDKKKQPSGEVVIRILDDKKNPIGEATKMMLPRDLPDGTDLEKLNLVAVPYSIYLNRPGRFTVEVVATDKNGDKTDRLSYPLTVLDMSNFTK
jgi:hypothetical protein